MLYHLLYQWIFRDYGAASESYLFKALNVFQYVTFRTAWATITALLISLFLGKWVIRKLEALKVGQEIREELSAEHQAKKGTPTMGGVLIIGTVILSTVLWARLDNLFLWLALGATTLFAAVGFADDYIKIVKKRSLGLTGRQKLAGQLFTALGVWAVLHLLTHYPWMLSIPFFRATVETDITNIGRGFIWFSLSRLTWVIERSKSYGRPRWARDERYLHRDGSIDRVDLRFERPALG